MAYHGVLDDLQQAIAMKIPNRLPVFVCSEELDVRIFGSRYDRYNRDAREMARVQIESVERFDYDWSWLQVDDCIEFEPLGVGVKGGGDILPATCEYLPVNDASLAALREHGYRVEGRMKALLDAITIVKNHFGDRVSVTGRTAAPFSSATLAFGISEIMTLSYVRPDFVREATAIFEEYQIRFGLDQIRAGADAIWFGDCNASGHLIGPDIYRDFALSPAKRVSDAYKEARGIVIYHASEERSAMVDLQAGGGFSILSVGPGIDIEMAREVAGDRVCLSGNVDPLTILYRGTPDAIRAEVERIVSNVSRNGGHIMNSGEMVPRDTPEDNIDAFIQSTRKAWEASHEQQTDLQGE